jgi:hypothetical protein
MSKDPFGMSGGLNQYVFCANDPVTGRDPLGLTDDLTGIFDGSFNPYNDWPGTQSGDQLRGQIFAGEMAKGWMTEAAVGSLAIGASLEWASICAYVTYTAAASTAAQFIFAAVRGLTQPPSASESRGNAFGQGVSWWIAWYQNRDTTPGPPRRHPRREQPPRRPVFPPVPPPANGPRDGLK